MSVVFREDFSFDFDFFCHDIPSDHLHCSQATSYRYYVPIGLAHSFGTDFRFNLLQVRNVQLITAFDAHVCATT